MNIRNAREEDVRQIAEIVVEDWKVAYRGVIEDEFLNSMTVEKQYQKEINRFQEYMVAVDGNDIIGFMWLQKREDKIADCEIVALYVRYSKRRNGIGKSLLVSAINHFKELGNQRMIIWCLKDNLESRKFYEKMGGKEFTKSSHKWGDTDYDIVSYLFDLKKG